MTHLPDSSDGRSYQPAEFQQATSFVLYQSEGEQTAHAELMRAEAGHRREETQHLRNRNWRAKGKLMLLGFVTYGGALAIGLGIGMAIGAE